MTHQELKDFVAYAKKKAYASAVSIPKKTKDGGKTYVIQKDGFEYRDTYFGNLIDCGQERVYFKGKVIWVMSYRGGSLNEKLAKKAFDFLKKCISKIPKEFPVRGPKKLVEGKWIYENDWKGDIKGFVGEENIYYGKEKICFRNYLGGLIKNKK